MWCFIITLFLRLLYFARWQTSLKQNFSTPHLARSLDRIGLAAPSFSVLVQVVHYFLS